MKFFKPLLLVLFPLLALPAAPQSTISKPSNLVPPAATASTAVPALIPYSGVAVTAEGKPLSGELGATFLIYKDETGGEPLFTESQTVAIDAAGHYAAQLGATYPNGLPLDLFSTGEARWLEVQIASQPPQARVLLVSVPYALKAADAATLGGLPASAFALAGTRNAYAASGSSMTADADPGTGVTTTGGTAGNLAEFSGASSIVDSPIFVSGANVGVGTATPTATLNVNGTGLFTGLLTTNGGATVGGSLEMAPLGTATTTASYESQVLKLYSSAYNSSTKAAVNPRFGWQVKPTGNNSATPSGTLDLLWSTTNAAPTATGFSFNPNGTMNFAAGQTFPGSGITGSVNATSYDLGGLSFATGSNASQTVFLGFTGNTTNTGLANAAVGFGALNANTAGASNTAIGAGALYHNTTGGGNTASGNGALYSNTTGTDNTATGVAALLSNTTGANNTAVGSDALNAETTGFANTAVGLAALVATTTGSNNTGVGSGALMGETSAGGNTAVGSQALKSDNTGFDNTAVGSAAGSRQTTATGNTAVGNLALQYSTIGGSNSALGASAGVAPAGGALTNTTTVGAFSTVNQNNSLILGNTTSIPGFSYVNVGIGTATPRSTLELAVSAPELGPTLTLTNPGGGADGASGIDFNPYVPSTAGTYNPAGRIVALNADYGADIGFLSNKEGAANQGLQYNMFIFANGDVDVAGTLFAKAKDFRIDDPLDPENKYLLHTSVESSEMMNIYSGNVTTDELGLATVTLPAWFEAENADFRYQLTVIGQFAQAIVKDKVANGQFRIMTNASHVEVSWQITAVRQDSYAKTHPLVVEQVKPARERAGASHPEFGPPASAVNRTFEHPAMVEPETPTIAIPHTVPMPQIKQATTDPAVGVASAAN
jgi:trimeric autotransporter adhesin